MWTAVIDGYVITQKMSDDDVWFRCQLFGREPLIEALEQFLEGICTQNLSGDSLGL